MIVRFGRSYRFFAAHRLHQTALSDDDNRRIFGKCNHPSGHGHTYEVTVVVEGRPDPRTMMVVDMVDMDAVVGDVLAEVAWRHLERDVPFFREHTSTSERIAQFLWQRLEAPLAALAGGVALQRIEVSETRNNHFELIRSAA